MLIKHERGRNDFSWVDLKGERERQLTSRWQTCEIGAMLCKVYLRDVVTRNANLETIKSRCLFTALCQQLSLPSSLDEGK